MIRSVLFFVVLAIFGGYAGYSQDMRLIFSDDTTNDNYVEDLIEDDDGNFVYVGTCANDGVMYTNNGLICKIAPDGRQLKRYVEYCADPYFNGTTNGLKFQRIFLTKDDTYFVIGSNIVDGDGFIIICEFDKDLGLIMKRETQISEDVSGRGTDIWLTGASYGDDEYVLSFYSICANETGWYGITYICKVGRDGVLSNINEVPRLNPSSGNNFICNVIPINNGENFMVMHPWGYIVYDSEINISEIVNFGMFTVFMSGACYGYSFDNDHALYFGCSGSESKNKAIDIKRVDLDDLRHPKILLRFGKGKTVDQRALIYDADTKTSEYVTENNIILGGTFNSIPEGLYMVSHSLYPTILGVGSYDRFENKLNWECYYEDGVHCFYMTSVCATRDGGAVIAATRASRSQAEQFLSDIVIFKIDGTVSIDRLEGKNIGFLVYPNPAKDRITIECEMVGFGEVVFYDLMGRLCKKVVVDGVKQDIDISDLGTGIYQLMLIGGDGTVLTERVVVK